MRKLVGILLLIAVPLHLVLGALFVLSSRYRAVAAEIESQDLSAVASDLASPEELAKERQAADQRLQGGRGGAQLAVGIALLASALLQLVAGIAALLGRGRWLVLATAVISLAAGAAALLLEGSSLLAAGGMLPVFFAGVFAAIVRRWGPPRAAPAAQPAAPA